MEADIPWVGAFGTNHQYIGSEGSAGTAGDWGSTGPGPHVPESADYNAGSNGIYMWLTDGSWLYARWDFGWPIDRSWSALSVTQVAASPAIPEPAGLGLLGLALVGLRTKRR